MLEIFFSSFTISGGYTLYPREKLFTKKSYERAMKARVEGNKKNYASKHRQAIFYTHTMFLLSGQNLSRPRS